MSDLDYVWAVYPFLQKVEWHVVLIKRLDSQFAVINVPEPIFEPLSTAGSLPIDIRVHKLHRWQVDLEKQRYEGLVEKDLAIVYSLNPHNDSIRMAVIAREIEEAWMRRNE